MHDRRQFLKGTVVTTAAAIAGKAAIAPAVAEDGIRPEELLEKEKMKVPGQFYEATVPDTLDLAERARLALSFLTHNVDPNYSYYNYQVVRFDSKNPGPDEASRQMDILGKNLRAIPWMRTMC